MLKHTQWERATEREREEMSNTKRWLFQMTLRKIIEHIQTAEDVKFPLSFLLSSGWCASVWKVQLLKIKHFRPWRWNDCFCLPTASRQIGKSHETAFPQPLQSFKISPERRKEQASLASGDCICRFFSVCKLTAAQPQEMQNNTHPSELMWSLLKRNKLDSWSKHLSAEETRCNGAFL